MEITLSNRLYKLSQLSVLLYLQKEKDAVWHYLGDEDE